MSESVGVRWQADMEDHLRGQREARRMVGLPNVKMEARQAYATAALADATAALALAIANTGGDLEVALAGIAAGMER